MHQGFDSIGAEVFHFLTLILYVAIMSGEQRTQGAARKFRSNQYRAKLGTASTIYLSYTAIQVV